MADTLRDKFFEAQASAALWDVAVSLKRGNALPLDANSVFKSMADVDTYRNGGGPAYPGQVLAIVEASQTKIYYLDQELNVQPVGIIPTGAGAISVTEAGEISVNVDNKSVEISDGKLAVHDFNKQYYKYIPSNVLSGDYASVEALPVEFKEDLTEDLYYKIGEKWYVFDYDQTAEPAVWAEVADDSKVRATSSYELTQGFKSGLEPRIRLNEDSQLEIGWYEPSSETVEGISSKVQSVQQTVEKVEENVVKVEEDVIDLQDSIYGEGGTAEAPMEGSIASNVNNLKDTVGSEDDSLGETVNTLWANVNDHKERIEALEEKEDKDTTYTAKADDKVLSLNGTEFYTELDLKHENGMISLTGKNGAVIAQFSDADFVKDSVLEEVEYNAESKEITFTWKTVDGQTKTDAVSVADFVQVYTAGNGLALENNEFAIKLDASCEGFLTVGENGLKLAGVQEAIDAAKQAAITAATESAAADATSKANAAQAAAIAAAAEDATAKAGAAKSEAIADAAGKYYGKGETYTKTEIDALLEGVQGGASESAASVKTQLDAYKKVVNAEIWGDEAGTGVDGNSRIDILDSKVDALEKVGAQANVIEEVKGAENNRLAISKEGKVVTIDDANLRSDIATAKKAGDDAASVASANSQAISNHDTRIGNLETAKNTHDQQILALQGEDTSIKGRLDQLENDVNNKTSGLSATYAKAVQNTTDINTLKAKDETHDIDIGNLKTTTANNTAAIAQLDTRVSNVYTKTESDAKYATIANMGTPAEGKTIVQMIADAQAAATYDDTQVKADIKKNADAIVDITKEGGAIATAVAAEAAIARAAEKANADEIARVDSVLKAAIENNGEGLDSIKELAVWIEQHGKDAAAMSEAITGNTQAIAAINDESTGILVKAKAHSDANLATAKAYADAELAKVHGVDDDTIKLKDNKAYVAKVSTDVLVQGESELVFCAGNATGYIQ